ncbi:hypothetical protein [Streptomyces sparsogenes]|uniref:hypothetical protein n=1 Tax=Streptomyces sparsogenes TaxID=67365 RepID=UPI003F4D6445
MTAGAYPFVGRMSPHRFTRLLACAEVGLGAALLSPMVPTALAGAALTTFASGLVGLYLRTPGLHQKGSPLPTEEGIPLAKDFWLLGIGLGFLCDRQAWTRPCLPGGLPEVRGTRALNRPPVRRWGRTGRRSALAGRPGIRSAVRCGW